MLTAFQLGFGVGAVAFGLCFMAFRLMPPGNASPFGVSTLVCAVVFAIIAMIKKATTGKW